MRRSRSRSPLKYNKVHEEVIIEDSDQSHDEGNGDSIDCSVIRIENIPKTWAADRVKQFVREFTKSQTILEGIKFVLVLKRDRGTGACLIKFHNSYVCNLAFAEWSIVSKERKITVKFDLENEFRKQQKIMRQESKNYRDQTNAKAQFLYTSKEQSNKKHPKMISDPEDNETYGLSLKYLQELNIKLPLRCRVYIANLHSNVDEAKIREVFSYAGHIVHIYMRKEDSGRHFAKVEYDHPIEAVQAISMFHNQELYSQRMIVHMDKKPFKNIPDGLNGFGPGLGPGGEPLRGARTYLELQAIKDLLMKEANKMKDMSQSENKSVSNMSQFQQGGVVLPVNSQMPVTHPIASYVAQTPLVPWNCMTTPSMSNMQLLQNITEQNTTDLQRAVNTLLQNKSALNTSNVTPKAMQASSWQTPGSVNVRNDSPQPSYSRMDVKPNDYRVNKSYETNNGRNFNDTNTYEERDTKRSTQRDEFVSNPDTSDMLVFKNLPSSVSLKALRNKMEEIGDLKFAEITGQGRAIVRFMSIRDAERCIKLFDKSKVDGQTIDVRFL